MHSVRNGLGLQLTPALVAVPALLAVLAATAGLGPLGWVAGVVCGAGTVCLFARALMRRRRIRPTRADLVTLTRGVLVAGVAALVVDSYVRSVSVPTLVLLSSIALTLDFVDGQVARRTGSQTELGARFDMEVDAFLILVLSGYVAEQIGGWVLAIGAARYAHAVAGRLLPWLRRPAPARYWCKVVAAIQGVVLTVAAAEVLPRVLTIAAVFIALVLLAESFGRDVWWLARHRDGVDAPAVDPAPAEPVLPDRLEQVSAGR